MYFILLLPSNDIQSSSTNSIVRLYTDCVPNCQQTTSEELAFVFRESIFANCILRVLPHLENLQTSAAVNPDHHEVQSRLLSAFERHRQIKVKIKSSPREQSGRSFPRQTHPGISGAAAASCRGPEFRAVTTAQ